MRLNGFSQRESVSWSDSDITDEHIDAPVPVDPLDRFVARGGNPECAPAILLQPSGETGGKTGLVIGYLHDKFIHVPIELLASQKKRLDPDGFAWSAVLAATGQPERFE